MINETFESYLTRPELNCSMAKLAVNNPEEFRIRQLPGCPTKPQSKSMGFGEYVHARILEPERASGFVVRPEGIDGRTKEGKAWIEAHEGFNILTADEGLLAEALIFRFLNHAILHNFAGPQAQKEVTMLSTIDGIGPVKCRLDSYAYGAICDIKTTAADTIDDFLLQCVEYDYDMQWAFYTTAYEMIHGQRPPWYFAALSKPSWQAWCLDMSDHPELMRSGEAKLQMAIKNIKAVRSPEYTASGIVVSMPQRAKWKIDSVLMEVLR